MALAPTIESPERASARPGTRAGAQSGRQADNPTNGRSTAKLGYIPGLDGLRAIAVLAVLAFHFFPDHSLLPGGFLGVEVFFVISGYLITSLLIAERKRRGKISLRGFWMRRIRRLFAAMYATLLSVGLFVAVFYNEELGRLRGPLFSSALYVTNWQQIFGHVRYGDESQRSPLGHLWSLAVEEQFYFIWPLIFACGMFFLGRRFRWVVGAGVLASWSWMAYLVSVRPGLGINGNREQQLVADAFNRIYLGTDTRAAGILLGSFMAFFWVPRLLRNEGGPHLRATLDGTAAVAAVVLTILMFTAELRSVWLYQWGFALVDLCAVVLIAAVVHPAATIGKVLAIKPLRVIGLRSYGIYLWGVAIFEFTRPGGRKFDLGLPGPAVFVLRLVIIAIVVEVSYRCIEVPIRNGALARLWQQLRSATGSERERLTLRWQVVTATLVVVMLALGVAAGFSSEPKRAEAVGGGDCFARRSASKCVPPTFRRSTSTTLLKPGVTATPGGPVVTTLPPVEAGGYAVTAVGDSVMLGAASMLQSDLERASGGGVLVNAEVSRQGSVCLETLRGISEFRILARAVVVHCGTNGYLPKNFVADVMALAGPNRRVTFVTVHASRAWEGPNNAMLTSDVAKYPNAGLLDWKWHAVRQPPTFFARDGFHLNDVSRPFYVDLIHKFLAQAKWL